MDEVVDGQMDNPVLLLASPRDDIKEQSNKQQHDLEKLQEAHDRLMHEVEEKRSFSEKLHLQLDRSIEQNEEMRVTLAEKDDDIKHLERQIIEKDAIIEKYKESETQIPKLKALAVKLKKQLAEAKEELENKSVPSSPAKDSSKQLTAEIERLSILYQNSVKNFQALQSEFDKLQDEYDQVVEKKKRSESDLNQSISELNKLRVTVAESKHENENLTRRVNELENESEVNFTRRKELESKIIVLQNELAEERKKLVNQAGLEKTLVELRKQIDLKTSEVVELSDLLEKQKGVDEENVRLQTRLNECDARIKELESENEETKEQNWNLSRKIESINSANEQEKIRLVDLVAENSNLTKETESFRDQFKRKLMEMEQKLKISDKKLEESREELETKNIDFENYKAKVFKVLNEKESNHLQLHELKISNQDLEEKVVWYEKRFQSLQQEIDSVKSQKEEVATEKNRLEAMQNNIKEELRAQLEESRREIMSLKMQNRELQNQLVTVRASVQDMSDKKSEYDILSKKLEQVESERQVLETRLKTFEEEQKRVLARKTDYHGTSESTTLTPENRGSPSGANPSPRSVDDVDSIGSTSLSSRTKRLSMSSVSDPALGASNNVLEELMNLRFDEDDGNISERGSGTIEGNVADANIKRLTELLEEGEAANALLTEQNRILKEEIRRLERAMSRIELAQNLEYLKNVLIKFSSLQNGSSEKVQLVSVLKTILKLSEEEESVLMKDATRSEPTSQVSSGWSSYIWS